MLASLTACRSFFCSLRCFLATFCCFSWRFFSLFCSFMPLVLSKRRNVGRRFFDRGFRREDRKHFSRAETHNTTNQSQQIWRNNKPKPADLENTREKI